MAGIQIIAKDKKGNIKQDYEVSRNATSGKVVKIDELKAEQIKAKAKKEQPKAKKSK
jgi:hypothetical protein